MSIVTEYDFETNTRTHHDARQTFRHLVADVAAKAKAKLPTQVNGRIESAVKLVLAHDVLFLEDGTVEVGSTSDPLKTYTLAGHACDCQDFAYGKAPDGWCAHRIAAGIAKRVGELLPVVPELVEPWPDNDPEPASQSTPVETGTVPPPALPEAAFSLCLKGRLAGQDAQLTIRGSCWEEFRANVEHMRGFLDPVPEQASRPHVAPAAEEPMCRYHGTMKASTKAPGTFFCTRKLADGSYCPSRSPEK